MCEINRHKTFISFRNPEGKNCKDKLVELNKKYNIFDDYSIGKGDIERSEYENDEQIRNVIINDWISGATVTILLVSNNMSESKFIDWEMQATMSDNVGNSKMGLLCITLPNITGNQLNNIDKTGTYNNLVKKITDSAPYGIMNNWIPLDRNDKVLLKNYPNLPWRVIKNIARENVYIDIISWNNLFKFGDQKAAYCLKMLIDKAFINRNNNDYDTHDKLQRTHK